MSVPIAISLILAGRLAMAAAAAAQMADEPPPPAVPGAAGVEVAAGSMMVVIIPALGGQVSIPASRRARLEVSAHALPSLVNDVDVVVVTQAQVRIPFRPGSPGRHRSLLLGATALTGIERGDSARSADFDTGVRPHAGFSWQWQKSRHLDMRIDLQGVWVTTSPLFFAAPFATFSMVWHRERVAS